ncbi:inositol-3-phosphate synthase [Streptomyces coerulescens]|uniref:Inositol-3-phosphate synthase n=1 Tax=Streptomyces coerulescens TaxID=29304 RepID=A0ABW0CSU2_STRCD
MATSTSTAADPRTGIWLIGARGSVATTVVAGCAAIAGGLQPAVGMVTLTAPFAGCGLPDLGSLVFGGHDVAACPLPKRAEQLAAQGVLPQDVPHAVRSELAAADAEIRTGGPLVDDLRVDHELISAFAEDIVSFQRRNNLARCVVVNVASTEPAPRAGDDGLPTSSLYAAAALRAGAAYVNFTPSTGLHHPALHGPYDVPVAGRDGKTGQTLLRSVLGPMFAQRALTVRSWSGTNLLGGGDGAALANPGAAAAKNAGKERVIAETLGTVPEGVVHIDDVPSMGDWKTAWDHITFEGFLGVRMILQTTWQGCDSALAAPLVLDLARLVARAHEMGLTGPLPELGFFFKDPDSGAFSSLSEQYMALLGFSVRLRAAGA